MPRVTLSMHRVATRHWSVYGWRFASSARAIILARSSWPRLMAAMRCSFSSRLSERSRSTWSSTVASMRRFSETAAKSSALPRSRAVGLKPRPDAFPLLGVDQMLGHPEQALHLCVAVEHFDGRLWRPESVRCESAEQTLRAIER